MSKILAGNWLLAICSIFYLAWWLITFRPPQPKGTMPGTICLTMAFASGLGGLYLVLKEMASPTVVHQNNGLNGFWILACGVVLYVVPFK